MNVMSHPAIQDPTHANIAELLEEQTHEAESVGVQVMRPELFCPEADVAQVVQARDWWPRDCPDRVGWTMAFAGSLAMQRTAVNVDTLLTHLHRCAERTAAWLVSEGRDPVHPNETKGERLARRNRERVAGHRAAHRAAPDGERPAASVAWDRVVELRTQRRAALADQDELVRQAYQLMTDRAEDRKALKRDWDARVTEAEEAHRAARAAS